jgi:ribosome biogenesis GTPase A
MKLSNVHLKNFLIKSVQDRIESITEEKSRLTHLLSVLEKGDLSNQEAAESWLELIKKRYRDIVSVKDIAEELGIKRSGINKAVYNVRGEEPLQKDVNQLVGVSLSGMNVIFRDPYDLWKNIREDEKSYPMGGELERKQIFESLPKNERQYLK